jgi:hypothetical protein
MFAPAASPLSVSLERTGFLWSPTMSCKFTMKVASLKKSAKRLLRRDDVHAFMRLPDAPAAEFG